MLMYFLLGLLTGIVLCGVGVGVVAYRTKDS